jgi:hypothetical protein
MRLKFLTPAVAALCAVIGAYSPAMADCGGCGASAVVACCPAAECCQPKVRYKHEWQTCTETRTRTCYKTVTETVMKEVRECVCKPVYETKVVECRKTICEQVWEEKQVKVCCGEWVTEQRKECDRTVCKKVRVKPCHETCDKGCGHECGGCNDSCGCGHGHGSFLDHFKREYCTVQEVIPGKTTCVKVWKPREEVRTVKVCKMVPREVVEKKNVTTCRMERQEVVKQVPCTVCKKVPYCETYTVCKKVRVCVPVCDTCSHHHASFGSFFHKSCKADCGGCGGCDHAPGALTPAPAQAAPMPAPAPARK